MKKLACLTISLMVVVLAFMGTFFTTASAAEETVYPSDKFTETISFSSLTDFAVGEEGYAFIDDGKLITIFGTDKKDDYEITPAAVDYVDGEFICSDSDGNVYALPDLAESDKAITEFSDIIFVNDNLVYSIVSDGTLVYYDATTGIPTEIDGGCTFKFLKTYSDTIYAVGTDDSSSCDRLYIISGSTAQPVEEELIYIDYAAASTISIGTAADSQNANSLYNLNADSLHFVTLVDDTYMTGIDLQSALSSQQYFIVSSAGTFKVGDANRPQGGDTAFLLCITGNASIIAIGEDAYILPSEGTSECDLQVTSTPETTLKGTAVASPCEIYSTPFISVNTQKTTIELGSEVTVTQIIASDLLMCDTFYKIEYTDADGETATGYVPQSFFSTYEFIESDPVQIPNTDPDTGDYVSTVVIVLIIIALALIGITYLVYVCTSDKNTPPDDRE